MITGATCMVGVMLIDSLMASGNVKVLTVGFNKEMAKYCLGKYFDNPNLDFPEQDVRLSFPIDLKAAHISQHIVTGYSQHGNNVTTHHRPSLWRELKRHTHTDYFEDRIHIAKALKDKLPNAVGKDFLADFELYAQRHGQLKYRLWCWNFRSRHYKEIYSTSSNKYKLIRALQYIITPPVA